MRQKTWIPAMLVVLLGAHLVSAAPTPTAPAPLEPTKDVKISDVSVKGTIEGENIVFQLDFTAECEKGGQRIALIEGLVVLKEVSAPAKGYRLSYDANAKRYVMEWPHKGTYKTSVSFVALPQVKQEAAWREAAFFMPASAMRELAVDCDRTDLEVTFPGALRVTRKVTDGNLTMTAVLGPGLPFAVRWKPQVEELDATLVLGSEANTIAWVRAGALRLDSVYLFEVAQGKLENLSFDLPPELGVTQVRGPFMRDWRVEGEGDERRLTVALNRPQTKSYALRIVSEMTLPKFPAEIVLPVVRPRDVIRAAGHLALGTDSAIQMVVGDAVGLSQTEPSGFPRIALDRENLRAIPTGKSFFYTYASTPYRMALALDDIVPSYDVVTRHLVNVREDDLTMVASLELDIRDAPLRELAVEAPANMVVASATGKMVEDYTVLDGTNGGPQTVILHFSEPVLGRTLVDMRLELGQSPLGEKQGLSGIGVRGAKNERGYVVVAAEPSVLLETPTPVDMREIHTGSVPMQVANAQFAYRYRERGWTLALLADKKPVGILAEAFHLTTLGEGAVYGYVVVNYVISGAPVDELSFRIPEQLGNVEFVGSDVRRWSQSGDLWTVYLARKVIGDYNLAVSYSYPYKPGQEVTVGAVECAGVERRSGFICVGSELNLSIEAAANPNDSLLEIKTEEIPPNYLLLLKAPVLKAYKYVKAPHRSALMVRAYEHAAPLPAVIELADMNTGLTITDAKTVESVTTIRYKVKNAFGQFLTLSMPAGAAVWSTRLIEIGPNGTESARRLAASLDRERGLLMIPLSRPRDPNDPITIELVYGQEHPELQGGGTLKLAAPSSPVQSTFAMWRVNAPEDWAILSRRGGNMEPKERPAELQGLGAVLSSVGRGWHRVLTRRLPGKVLVGIGIAVIVFLVALFLTRVALVLKVGLVLALLALLLLGIQAADATNANALLSRSDLRTVTYTRALSVDDASAMNVIAYVVPAWRRYATVSGVIVAGAAGLVCLVWAWRARRGRAVALGLGIALLASVAARFPVCALVMAHVMTWGAPVMLMMWLLPRFLKRVRPVALATAALALICLLPGCAWLGTGLPEQPTVNRVEYDIVAEKDSVSVDIRLQIATREPMQLALLPETAILLTKEDDLSDDVEVIRGDGNYKLDIKKKGRYDLTLKFLSALEGGDDQLRFLSLRTPMALTNRVTLTIPEKGIEVTAPTAVFFEKEETETGTTARAIVAPGDLIQFVWRPRARERKLEETSFYADLLGVVRFDTGVARGRHRVRFQIAQGELKEIRIRAPENVTVTSVEGEGLGAWRFDPATQMMEARLVEPVSGEYVLTVTTQIASRTLPASLQIGALHVEDAVEQRAALGLAASPAVFITVPEQGQPMNVDDFAREAASLIASDPKLAGATPRHAFRIREPDEKIAVDIDAVRPEIRSTENATFTVSEERLVYNGDLGVSVAKAGVFTLALSLPEGFDIDTLTAPEVSHWDEVQAEGQRIVQVHFRNKLLGNATLKLALSRPVAELPEEIMVPRVRVAESLKHGGRIAIGSTRNVRLSVKRRQGVSELNAIEIGIREPGALAFSLLRPEWELALKTEVVNPRINVAFLHVARISDGIVRREDYLRYRFYNAGVKVLNVRVPKDALGLEISGPDIAHLKEVEPGSGLWRIELSQKQFERPYLLSLRYETQYERSAGEVPLAPSEALDVDLQSGHVVVYATDRVEVSEVAADESLQRTDARGLRRIFGAEDLSSAAICYSAPAPDYKLTMSAVRHKAAALLEATVLETVLETVVSLNGQTLTRAHLQLRVGDKRHLEVRLPANAVVWSAAVNLRSETPSMRREAGENVTLIPLTQAAGGGELPVEVDLIYVTTPLAGWRFAAPALAGPRFDLPLQNVSWRLYLPEDYEYKDFTTTLNVNEDTLREPRTHVYDANAYERRVTELNVYNRAKALELQAQGDKLAQEGKPNAARQALSWANNYSFNDAELNEDTRVQLNSLIRQQAVVGLVGRRNQLRQKKGDYSAPVNAPGGAEFNTEQAQRVENSLDRDDGRNLQQITTRLVELQEEASRAPAQLTVNVPLRGRVIELTRPLQVKPNAEMSVSFESARKMPKRMKYNGVATAGLAVVLILLFFGDRKIRAMRREFAVRAAEAAAAQAKEEVPPAPETAMTDETEE